MKFQAMDNQYTHSFLSVRYWNIFIKKLWETKKNFLEIDFSKILAFAVVLDR